MSTMNTRTSAELEVVPGGVPNPDPSSVSPLRESHFELDSAAIVDFDDVVNYVQRHKGRPEGGTARVRLAQVRVCPPCSSVGLATRIQSVGRRD